MLRPWPEEAWIGRSDQNGGVVSAIGSVFRVAVEIVVGLLLAGLLVGLLVPARPETLGPATALGIAMLCVGGVVLLDWTLLRRR